MLGLLISIVLIEAKEIVTGCAIVGFVLLQRLEDVLLGEAKVDEHLDTVSF